MTENAPHKCATAFIFILCAGQMWYDAITQQKQNVRHRADTRVERFVCTNVCRVPRAHKHRSQNADTNSHSVNNN